MASFKTPKDTAPQILIRKLCANLTGLKDDALLPYYQITLTTLGSSVASSVENDEFVVSEKIKKKLSRQGRDKDAAVFAELHRKLQAQDSILKNRTSLLILLLKLSDNKGKYDKLKGTPALFHGLAGHQMSTPYMARGDQSSAARHTISTGGSSGFSSIRTVHSNDPTPQALSLPPSHWNTPAVTPFLAPQSRPAALKLMPSYNRSSHSQRSESAGEIKGHRHKGATRDGANTTYELPESVILREIIYVFQGIEGSYIKSEHGKEGYKIDQNIGIPKSVRSTVAKLAECGWLYSKIRKYADSRSTDRAFGLVGQSFCAALHQELAEYYRLIAVLEAQLEQEEDQGVNLQSGCLTLRRLSVWVLDPLIRLKTLAALVDVCQAKKGGALASAIHSYIQHGDPSIQALVKHTLTLVAQPIFSTITRWIYDGELEDTYHEFFVASDPTVKDDRLWHDKYSLRKSMVPSFLTMEQAKKILATGKSINFLRQVCHDRTAIRKRDVVKATETQQVESIFRQDTDHGEFQKMIDTVYKETSSHLLDILNNKYKFMDHLKAMRRYLLLGQGDFNRHLMDLLEGDLAKPASQLYLHDLTGILETAIRATNAQYDDPEILKRLDVRLLEVSPGDTGWDVFSLDYHVDGPMRTVFTPECVIMYLRVFNFLWRAKRMEYILAAIWKSQMSHAKTLRAIPELKGVLHLCHTIGAEMVHFVQQVQYYINFEVLECSWDELVRRVQEAEDLDHIIAAHQVFLDSVITRSLLDQTSTAIHTQLRTIFDLIIQFQTIQSAMYEAASEELLARQCYQDKIKLHTAKGKWGLSDAEESEESSRKDEFRTSLVPSTRSKLKVLSQSYQNMVQQFLVMLANHPDNSLRFLSVRLDFNEHYRAKEPKIRPSRGAQIAKKR